MNNYNMEVKKDFVASLERTYKLMYRELNSLEYEEIDGEEYIIVFYTTNTKKWLKLCVTDYSLRAMNHALERRLFTEL